MNLYNWKKVNRRWDVFSYFPKLVNIHGEEEIGYRCRIAPYTDIGGIIGKECKIQSFAFIPQGVIIGNNCFIGPNVTFTNVKNVNPKSKAFKYEKTIVEDNVVIGAGSTILSGITIGENSTIGAGSVVTKDVKESDVVCGNPAKSIYETTATQEVIWEGCNESEFKARVAERYEACSGGEISKNSFTLADSRDEVLLKASKAIASEYLDASIEHEPFNSAHEGYAIILEELHELWDEVKKNGKYRNILRLKAEAIQVGAMALRFLVDICGDTFGGEENEKETD